MKSTTVVRVRVSPVLRAMLLSAAGVVGYHYFEDLPWIDSLLNASMILGGMGPVNALQTNAGKIFASFYALYSGIILLASVGILITPVFHRFLHRFHLELEDTLARLVNKEAVLLYSTGFQVNLGVISALVGKGDYVVGDKSNHASIVEGCLMAQGKFFRFPHRDLPALEELQQGDLLFFQTYADFPSHVGIYIGDRLMIHASSHGGRGDGKGAGRGLI